MMAMIGLRQFSDVPTVSRSGAVVYKVIAVYRESYLFLTRKVCGIGNLSDEVGPSAKVILSS